MIKEFGGVNLSASDILKSVTFYRDILKLPVLGADYIGSEDPDAANNIDLMDGIELGFIKDAPHIWIWDANKWGKTCEGGVNFVFSADDLDELYKYLRENGVDCESPFDTVWGGRELKVSDPDGNVLTIL